METVLYLVSVGKCNLCIWEHLGKAKLMCILQVLFCGNTQNTYTYINKIQVILEIIFVQFNSHKRLVIKKKIEPQKTGFRK